MAQEPILNISGEKVALGPFHQGVVPLLSKWDNDFEVSFFSGDPVRSVPPATTESRFEQSSRDTPRDRVDFIIYEKETLRPIGLTELRHINYRSGTADYGILIGEKDCWSKGYGTETTLLMLDYGFSVLSLHNITLETYAYNERAIKAYQRAGFQVVGRRREVNRWGDKRYDEIIMDCLATEFQTPLKHILKLP